MKTTAAFAVACIASTSAFAPINNGARPSTQLQKSFFKTVFDMDLFAPVSDQNDYGARNKKNVSFSLRRVWRIVCMLLFMYLSVGLV